MLNITIHWGDENPENHIHLRVAKQNTLLISIYNPTPLCPADGNLYTGTFEKKQLDGFFQAKYNKYYYHTY